MDKLFAIFKAGQSFQYIQKNTKIVVELFADGFSSIEEAENWLNDYKSDSNFTFLILPYYINIQ